MTDSTQQAQAASTPNAAVEAADHTHWIIFRDERGWGCQGCDWTGASIDDYYDAHGRPEHDSNIPF